MPCIYIKWKDKILCILFFKNVGVMCFISLKNIQKHSVTWDVMCHITCLMCWFLDSKLFWKKKGTWKLESQISESGFSFSQAS